MIRLFLYRLFWAIYDYLGTLTLAGLAGAFVLCALLAPIVIEWPLASYARHPVAVAILLLVALIWVVFCLAVFAHAGRRIATEESFRVWHVMRPAVRSFWRTLQYGLVVGGGLVLLAANVVFYGRQAAHSRGPAGLMFVSLAIFFVYLILCFCTYAMALLGAWIFAEPEGAPIRHLREALVALVITPWLWIFSLVTFLVFALLAAISVLGILFILPLWSVISCVAYRLAHEFAANLRLARDELGERKPLRTYRKRAEELCMIQEMQKPVRTWRDVFKPWDY
jgi:hypothetical protein